jgi:hypothetical protein
MLDIRPLAMTCHISIHYHELVFAHPADHPGQMPANPSFVDWQI